MSEHARAERLTPPIGATDDSRASTAPSGVVTRTSAATAGASSSSTARAGATADALGDTSYAINERTRAILDHRRKSVLPSQRGWLLHRALVLADVLGLLLAFAAASTLTSSSGPDLSSEAEALLLVLSLPLWIVLIKLEGLYDRDEERTDHSTVDEITAVFKVVTLGTWLFFVAVKATDVFTLSIDRTVVFWMSAVVLIPLIRAFARAACRRSIAYIQNAVVVGTGADWRAPSGRSPGVVATLPFESIEKPCSLRPRASTTKPWLSSWNRPSRV